jgi:hypothetical protein
MGVEWCNEKLNGGCDKHVGAGFEDVAMEEQPLDECGTHSTVISRCWS